MKKKNKVLLGDVYSIPLPDGKFAFGRIFNDASIAIYTHIGKVIDDLPQCEEYQFVVGIYRNLLDSGAWTVVDHRPFCNQDESWPPPNYCYDIISKKFSIYYKGEFLPSTEDECKGLEQAAVWDANHIVDRIMGDDKWNKN